MHLLTILAQAPSELSAGSFVGFWVVGIIAIVAGLFWLWMLVDVLTNEALDSTMKLFWALVIFFLNFLGALIYYFVGRKSRSRRKAGF
jgi:uncharacterized membrane protein